MGHVAALLVLGVEEEEAEGDAEEGAVCKNSQASPFLHPWGVLKNLHRVEEECGGGGGGGVEEDAVCRKGQSAPLEHPDALLKNRHTIVCPCPCPCC